MLEREYWQMVQLKINSIGDISVAAIEKVAIAVEDVRSCLRDNTRDQSRKAVTS